MSSDGSDAVDFWEQTTVAEKIWVAMMLFLVLCCLLALVGILWVGGIWIASMNGWPWGPWAVRLTVIALFSIVFAGISLHHHVTKKPPLRERKKI